jgi:Na+/H+ antiporter NhaD/arsenite permease-like protein
MSCALTTISPFRVAESEVRAQALLWSALLVRPTLDERVEGTTALGHVDVQALDFVAAMYMAMRDTVAFVLHGLAMVHSVAHVFVATTEASL